MEGAHGPTEFRILLEIASPFLPRRRLPARRQDEPSIHRSIQILGHLEPKPADTARDQDRSAVPQTGTTARDLGKSEEVLGETTLWAKRRDRTFAVGLGLSPDMIEARLIPGLVDLPGNVHAAHGQPGDFLGTHANRADQKTLFWIQRILQRIDLRESVRIDLNVHPINQLRLARGLNQSKQRVKAPLTTELIRLGLRLGAIIPTHIPEVKDPKSSVALSKVHLGENRDQIIL